MPVKLRCHEVTEVAHLQRVRLRDFGLTLCVVKEAAPPSAKCRIMPAIARAEGGAAW